MKKKLFISFLCFISSIANANTLMIGDSVFALTEAVPNNLRAAGLRFEMRAETGAGIDRIFEQYQEYKLDFGSPPSIVIVNGGGNDILLSRYLKECIKKSEICDYHIYNVAQKGAKLLLEFAKDNVSKVIFLGIHYLGNPLSVLNPTIDLGMSLFQTMCDGSPAYCVFVDPRPFFGPDKKVYLFDGVHPNKSGSEIISAMILTQF